MSDSSKRTFSRGRGGGGRNRGRGASSLSADSWRSGGPAGSDNAPATNTAPAPSPAPTPAPAPPQAPAAPAPAAGAAPSPALPRARANSHRKGASRAGSLSAAAPPPITVTAPAVKEAPAPAAATPATPKSNKKGGRSRKASVASSTLAPIASSSASLAPIASAPPNTTGFGTKASIDSLVQHIRASAIDHSGKGDWAQDNDDSLPDLDDWDIDSKSNASGASNVLVVKPTPPSIKTAPVVTQGLAAQQKQAKDKLADGKKSRRGGKGKNKDKGAGSEASPISPPESNPTPTSLSAASTPSAFAATAPASHPMAVTTQPARALPAHVAVQLPKAGQKGATEMSPTGQTPLLPSPVFATLNPPFVHSTSNTRRPSQLSKGETKSRDSTSTRTGAASARKKDHPPHIVPSNSAALGAISEEILSARAVTKPTSPIERAADAQSVVRLPSPTNTTPPPGSHPFREQASTPDGDRQASSSKAHQSKGSHDASAPSTPKTNGNAGLPTSSHHRRTPSNQSQTNAPHSPRQRNFHADTRETFSAAHNRTFSASRPKISVSALFQLNKSLAGSLVSSSKPSQSPAVA